VNELELSEKIVADVLVKLFEHGLTGIDIKRPSDITDTEVDSEKFMSIMNWLKSEKLIYFDFIDTSHMQGRSAIYRRTVFTIHGFASMGHEFGVIKNLTIGQAAKKVSEDGSNFASAGDFVGGLLGGFTKSISTS